MLIHPPNKLAFSSPKEHFLLLVEKWTFLTEIYEKNRFSWFDMKVWIIFKR